MGLLKISKAEIPSSCEIIIKDCKIKERKEKKWRQKK